MPSLNHKEKVWCENYGTEIKKANFARHKKRCSSGALYCTQFPNFSTTSQVDVINHMAKKHSAPKPDVTFKSKNCY